MIPTEWIDLRDTEFLLSLTSVDDLESSNPELDFSAAGDDNFGDPPPGFGDELPDFDLENNFDFEDDDAPWRPKLVFPRYQLQVMLRDDAAVP